MELILAFPPLLQLCEPWAIARWLKFTSERRLLQTFSSNGPRTNYEVGLCLVDGSIRLNRPCHEQRAQRPPPPSPAAAPRFERAALRATRPGVPPLQRLDLLAQLTRSHAPLSRSKSYPIVLHMCCPHSGSIKSRCLLRSFRRSHKPAWGLRLFQPHLPRCVRCRCRSLR